MDVALKIPSFRLSPTENDEKMRILVWRNLEVLMQSIEN